MEIGPFNVMEVDAVKKLLDLKQVGFTLFIDKDLEHQLISEFNMRALAAPREAAGSLDLKIIFMEISDSDFEKVEKDLEKYGVVQISDGSFELGEES